MAAKLQHFNSYLLALKLDADNNWIAIRIIREIDCGLSV
jgi:hypothetical protein